MPSASPFARPSRRYTPAVGTLALGLAPLAALLGVSLSPLRARIGSRSLAHLRIGGAIRILNGDWERAAPWPETPPDYDGRDTLREAWRGRDVLRVADLCEAFGLNAKTVQRAASNGLLPAYREWGGGPWRFKRDELIDFLLRERVGARWERCSAVEELLR